MNINWANPLLSVGLFVIYIITSCFGLYLIKASESWRSSSFVFGFGFYAAGALLWMAILRLMPLSFAFPIASGALVVGTMLTGAFFLNETVTTWQTAGALMIITGIAIIAVNR